MRRTDPRVGASSDPSEFEGDPPPERTDLVRWLPLVLPVGMLALSIVTALTLVIPPGGDWTVGDDAALRAATPMAVVAAVVASATWMAIERADQRPNWRWAAWVGSGVVIADFILR